MAEGMTTGRLAPKSSMTKNSGGFLRMEELVGVLEVADFDAVDLVHGEAGEVAELAGDRIALDAGEHDDVPVFLETAPWARSRCRGGGRVTSSNLEVAKRLVSSGWKTRPAKTM